MKRITCMAAILLAVLPMQAQTAEGQNKEAKARVIDTRPVNELSISYGGITLPDIAMSLGGAFATVFTFGLGKMSDMSFSGAFEAEYLHYVTPRIAVGAAAGYEHITMTMDTYNGKDENGNSQYAPGKKDHISFIHLMPEIKASWFYTPRVSMYSKAAIGVAVSTDADESVKESVDNFCWALQLTPIGIDFGGRSFRGFAELGGGFQGLLVGGLRYSF